MKLALLVVYNYDDLHECDIILVDRTEEKNGTERVGLGYE